MEKSSGRNGEERGSTLKPQLPEPTQYDSKLKTKKFTIIIIKVQGVAKADVIKSKQQQWLQPSCDSKVDNK